MEMAGEYYWLNRLSALGTHNEVLINAMSQALR